MRKPVSSVLYRGESIPSLPIIAFRKNYERQERRRCLQQSGAVGD
jgi:hypothetical protein